MADHDRRGHGGPRGGFNNRKRRYRDDDDHDRKQQRRRVDEPGHLKLRRQLTSIAELPTSSPEDTVDEVVKIVLDGFEDPEIHDTFMDVFFQLIVEQPLKIPFLSAVVLLANTQNAAVASEVLKRVGSSLEDCISNGSWREVKLLLRLVASLQGLLSGDGVFMVLDELFSRAVDLQTASSEDGLGLELIKIILLTIAYAMGSTATDCETRAAALLEKTEIVASAPHTLEYLVEPYPGNGASSKEPKSVINLLQGQLQSEASRAWPLQCLPRPWKKSTYFGNLNDATKHTLSDITVPSNVSAGRHPHLPEVFFSVYADQDFVTVPPDDDIACCLVRDAAIDTINVLHFNRNIAAKSLIDLDCYFAPGTFVKRATAFDKLKDLEPDATKWKPEDVAVDAVFSQLFQLPIPEHKLVYYHSVLTEACKIAPAAIAPSLGRAIRYLYKYIQAMDLELNFRFVDWFSHHLSNFGFTWKWTEWAGDVDLPLAHPKKSFIAGALEKEVRLSFAQRIKGTLPEPYQPFLATDGDVDIPNFKYSDDREPYAVQGRELLRLLRTKAPDSEIEVQLASVQEEAISQGVNDPLVPSTDVFVTSLCVLGAKSLSHVLSCIERYKERLLSIGPTSEAARRQILGSVLSYWKEKPGVGINIVDKLLNYTILTPMSVIEWISIDQLERGKILTHSHIYEMVANTVFKVTNRVRQIVIAKNQPGLAAEQTTMLEDTLSKEQGQMRQLFVVLEDGLKGISDGSADAMAESRDQDSEGEALLRDRGQAWLRVFQRKLAVEEAWILETLSLSTSKSKQDSSPNGASNGQVGHEMSE